MRAERWNWLGGIDQARNRRARIRLAQLAAQLLQSGGMAAKRNQNQVVGASSAEGQRAAAGIGAIDFVAGMQKRINMFLNRVQTIGEQQHTSGFGRARSGKGRTQLHGILASSG